MLMSCSVQKRLHQPGWHIEWKSNRHYAQLVKSQSSEISYSENGSSKSTTESKLINSLNNEVKVVTLVSDTIIKEEVKALDIIEQHISNSQNRIEVISAFSTSKKNVIEEKQLIKAKFKSPSRSSNEWNFFYWLIIFYCLLLLSGGICALIFGQHWFLIVLGILAVIFAVIALLVFLISVAVGKSIARDVKKTWKK